jgi:hypothetical protein
LFEESLDFSFDALRVSEEKTVLRKTTKEIMLYPETSSTLLHLSSHPTESNTENGFSGDLPETLVIEKQCPSYRRWFLPLKRWV